MNEEGRRKLKETCIQCEARLQTATVNGKIQFWVQSIHVGRDKGGYVWKQEEDGSVWMTLGGAQMSAVCGRLVQICWKHSREEIHRALQMFGE
eukprot:6052214-Karenia_brevis.AAC.1